MHFEIQQTQIRHWAAQLENQPNSGTAKEGNPLQGRNPPPCQQKVHRKMQPHLHRKPETEGRRIETILKPN